MPDKFDDIELDLVVVMPNHFHGIVCINRSGIERETGTSLSDVVRWFKAMTTNAYIQGVKIDQWQRFRGKLWQRSYYDHIVRNDRI